MNARLGRVGVWLSDQGRRVWPLVLVGGMVWLSWGPLRAIHTRDVRAAFHGLRAGWLVAAVAATLANIVAMGLYDVVAFARTRTTPAERWRFGAVAFAWSNFLTLGPLAGPAVRFWLYRPAVDDASELQAGVLSVTIGFASGLVGWTLAVVAASTWQLGVSALLLCSAVLVCVCALGTRALLLRFGGRYAERLADGGSGLSLAAVGWFDWLLAGGAFIACVKAAGVDPTLGVGVLRSFFVGQSLGVASLIPGGFGSSDAYWIAHLPLASSAATAALMAYRAIYYVAPWAIASLCLLSWVSSRAQKRLELARRIVAGLVGGGGVLMILSSASPAVHARLPLLERLVPLPLVEVSVATAAVTGMLLLVLARGLARGYRAAFRGTLMLLTLGGIAALLKGLDWEEALLLLGVAAAARSQSGLFTEESAGARLVGSDLILAIAGLALFLVFGIFSFHLKVATLEHWTRIGYGLQAARFIRAAGSMAIVAAAAAIYAAMRPRVTFARLDAPAIEAALRMHASFGGSTQPMLVATGDKAVFAEHERAFCLYRTIGPYMAVFADPVVAPGTDRSAFLDAICGHAASLDRRPVFYQVSPNWMPELHDRGYVFFKVGEEAYVDLTQLTREGSAGKLNRQLLKRGEKDGLSFRVMEPCEVACRIDELRAVSDDWLSSKHAAERGFSVGFFDEAYLCRGRCAVVEHTDGRLLAFANLLEGPRGVEISVDLMRYRSDGPTVMDFLMVSLFLHGQAHGYARFNLGMAPLASVGARQGAHRRERLAHWLFRRGEQIYNFQGLRRFKQKFSPTWEPRYLAYQHPAEWPVAAAYLGALTAGGWSAVVGRSTPQPVPAQTPVEMDSAVHAA